MSRVEKKENELGDHVPANIWTQETSCNLAYFVPHERGRYLYIKNEMKEDFEFIILGD